MSGAEATLVCLACRARTARGRELYTLSAGEGGLTCDNERCRRRYPIVDGIPVVAADAEVAVVPREAAEVAGAVVSP